MGAKVCLTKIADLDIKTDRGVKVEDGVLTTSVDDILDNPEIDIDDTDGYSIALYGHYLTQIVDEATNQMSSTIIKQMWELFQMQNWP